MNKLAAVQQQDQPNLEAACQLAQQKGFSLAKSTGGYVYPDPSTHRRNESAASEDLMAAT